MSELITPPATPRKIIFPGSGIEPSPSAVKVRAAHNFACAFERVSAAFNSGRIPTDLDVASLMSAVRAPDFDFSFRFPNKRTPLIDILELSEEDPDLVANKRIYPVPVVLNAFSRLSEVPAVIGHVTQRVAKDLLARTVDEVVAELEQSSVAPDRAELLARSATSITLALLAVAEERGVAFHHAAADEADFSGGPRGYFIEKVLYLTSNLTVIDWLIHHGATVGIAQNGDPLSADFSRCVKRLHALQQCVFDNIAGSRHAQLLTSQTSAYFSEALKKQELDVEEGVDVVANVVMCCGDLPENLALSLLTMA